MLIAILPAILAVGSGAIIGLVLGLVGGGGSILAGPLARVCRRRTISSHRYRHGSHSGCLQYRVQPGCPCASGNGEVALCARLRRRWCVGLGTWSGTRQGHRRTAPLGLIWARDGRSRPQHVATFIETCKRKRSTDAGLRSLFGTAPDRPGLRSGRYCGLLRHWRRLSDCAGPDAGDRHGATQCGRDLARRRGGVRSGDGRKLYHLGVHRRSSSPAVWSAASRGLG